MGVSYVAFYGCVDVEARRQRVARVIEQSVMTGVQRIASRRVGSLVDESLVPVAVEKMMRSESCLLTGAVEDPCWRLGLGRRLPTEPRKAAG